MNAAFPPARPGALLLMSASLAAMLALAGCKPAASSQDIATGKDFALSRGEFGEALSHVTDVPRTLEGQARRNVLARLIDEKLLAGAASAEGIERDPVVIAQLEAARRTILAKAYATRVTAAVTPPADPEIAAFYAARPEAFAQRREAAFDQVAFAGTAAPATRLAQAYDAGTPLEVLRADAGRQGVAIARGAVTTTSDRLPTAVARQLQSAVAGDKLIFPVAEGMVHATLRAITPAPLTLEQARPLIREALQGQRRDALLQKDIARLRQAAAIRIADPALAANASSGTTALATK